MSYLLDTHVLLWSLLDTDKISKKAKAILENKKNEIVVSVLSLWEISMKCSLGKIDFENLELEDIPTSIEEIGYGLITLDPIEAISYNNLPLRSDHRDPYDRMLVWQAISRDMILVSKDKAIHEYKKDGLKVIW